MRLFKWLYHVPERVNRSMEKTAIASSIDADEGSQVNALGVQSGLGYVEPDDAGEADTADTERG